MSQTIDSNPNLPPQPLIVECPKAPPCPPPIWERTVIAVLIAVLIGLLLLVGAVAMNKQPPAPQASKCGAAAAGESACAPGAAPGEFGRFMSRCTREEGYSAGHCASMWERVQRGQNG